MKICPCRHPGFAVFLQHDFTDRMIMEIYRKRLMPAVAVILALIACDKTSGNENAAVPDSGAEPPVMERPSDLVTEVYTAYPSGVNACVDSYLTLEFKSVPRLGRSGSIRILDQSGAVADVIKMEDIAVSHDARPQLTGTSLFTTAMDAIGSPAAGRYRIVYYDPVKVEGNTVTVRLHSDRLGFGQTYSVEIGEGVIEADGFSGIGAGEWTFTVMPQPEKDTEVTVGSRDSDFMTVQGAVNFANSCGQSHEMVISVSPGVYEEQLYIRSKNHLTIRGAGKESTVIRFDNCNAYTDGVGSGVASVPELGEAVGKAGGRSVVLVEDCDMLRFENLSLENTHGHGSQAETVYFNSDDGRLIAVNCNFTGEQDTVELKGWCLFRGCTLTGDVDFIWGYARTALFESCEIRSCENANGGYIVQARCDSGDRGFVFLDCDITAESGVADGSVYLARSGGDGSCFDNVTYIGCRMGDHIADAGWYSSPAPNPSAPSGENGWKEYLSKNMSGVSLDVSSRYSGSRQISAQEYESLYKDAAAIFSDCPEGTDWVL